MQNECKLSIITVNYNGLKDTCDLIDSIPFTPETEVIVVDNASKNDEASIIADKYPQVKVIRSSRNLGFAGGNNLGIKAASGQYLFLVNNDTEFNSGKWREQTEKRKLERELELLIERFKNNAKIGMVCPKIRFAWKPQPIQFAGYTPLSPVTMRNHSIGYNEEDHGQYDFPHPTPYAHGAAMMVKREAIERVGLIPECFFLYYEELDWSMMFTRAGYEIWYDPCFTIYHKESQTTGQDSPLKTYYCTRNRLLFIKRNISAPIKYASYLYIISIVATRDIIKSIVKGRTDLAKAMLRGIINFIRL